MSKIISPLVEQSRVLAEMKAAVPEVFDVQGRLVNLVEGQWKYSGNPMPFISPVDGSVLGHLPMLQQERAAKAVKFAAEEAQEWAKVDLQTRKAMVQQAVDALTEHRELIAKLLMWEIGKPWKQALTDIDRCNEGVQWYIDNIEGMMEERTPIGLVSNIASWNYPMSVLMHAVLVQMLAGNAAIAKTPTDGGFMSLSVGFALARRQGLPISLVNGSGGALSEILVRNAAVDCFSFVGGRTTGRNIAAQLYDQNKRYMFEMEGVNTYGIWEFSDWDLLASHIKKGYDYGKQRCTAYVRFVVQRSLFPKFLETYLKAMEGVKVGNPTLVDNPEDELPVLDFGPLVNRKQVEELKSLYYNAQRLGAVPVYEGKLEEDRFLPEQDMSAYMAPCALVNLPRNSDLYYKEPFGPLDTFILVDRVEELVGEMNISNGSLVSAIASDDAELAERLSKEIRAFKVGINGLRSRGDGPEYFGGLGESWKGCFVGGELLVKAVTNGPEGEQLPGIFHDHVLLPEKR